MFVCMYIDCSVHKFVQPSTIVYKETFSAKPFYHCLIYVQIMLTSAAASAMLLGATLP